MKNVPSHRRFRIVDRETVKVQFQFEPRDIWLGVFWRRSKIALHVCVCVVPLFPLHITIWRGEEQ